MAYQLLLIGEARSMKSMLIDALSHHGGIPRLKRSIFLLGIIILIENRNGVLNLTQVIT